MIASLPMYDRPELVDAHDSYWRLINRQLAEQGIECLTDCILKTR